MVGFLASRSCGGILDIALDTIVARSADSDVTALHKEVLLAVDTIACGRSHIDSGILNGEVLTCLDAVLLITHDIKRTLLSKLSMPLDI